MNLLKINILAKKTNFPIEAFHQTFGRHKKKKSAPTRQVKTNKNKEHDLSFSLCTYKTQTLLVTPSLAVTKSLATSATDESVCVSV